MANTVHPAPTYGWCQLTPEFRKAVQGYRFASFEAVALACGFGGIWVLGRILRTSFVLDAPMEDRLRRLAGLVLYAGPLTVPARGDEEEEGQ